MIVDVVEEVNDMIDVCSFILFVVYEYIGIFGVLNYYCNVIF